MATELQELVRDLQLDFQGEDELQRICARIQNELHSIEQRVRPQAAPPVQLTPAQRQIWTTFQAFLAELTQYTGWVNRDQWLQLLDIAADLLSAGGGNGTGTGTVGPQGPPGPIGPPGVPGVAGAPGLNGLDGLTPHIGVNGNWWLGTTDTGVAASGGGIGDAPTTGAVDGYLRNGLTGTWQLITLLDGGLY